MFSVSNALGVILPGCLLVGIMTVKLHVELPCHSKNTLLGPKVIGTSKQRKFSCVIEYHCKMPYIPIEGKLVCVCAYNKDVANIEVKETAPIPEEG